MIPAWLLVGAGAIVITNAATGYFMYGAGGDACQAKHTDNAELIRQASDAAQEGAAKAIAAQRPRNVTIKQETEREIQTHVQYRDCRASADGLRLANEALTGRPEPAGAGKLPGTDTPER